MTAQTVWIGIGFLGQALFSARFLIQWLASERSPQSVVSSAFWWFSMAGGAILLSYALWNAVRSGEYLDPSPSQHSAQLVMEALVCKGWRGVRHASEADQKSKIRHDVSRLHHLVSGLGLRIGALLETAYSS